MKPTIHENNETHHLSKICLELTLPSELTVKETLINLTVIFFIDVLASTSESPPSSSLQPQISSTSSPGGE